MLMGIFAGPLFITCVYQVVGRTWRFVGEWVITGWADLLIPIVSAAVIAGLVHWKVHRLRVFGWTLFASATAFHLWFSFVVVASLPGRDF